MSQSAAQRRLTCGEADERETLHGVASFLAQTSLRAIEDLLTLLHDRMRLDFRVYRRRLVTQRIARRMQFLNLPHIDAYLQQCHASPAEIKRLGRDILSGPTPFFRDPDAFARLETLVMPALMQRGAATGGIRVWVAGCAAGEDAYTIGMLLREQCNRLGAALEVKIFATDVDAHALRAAARGLYAESRLAHVSEARLQRFFHRHGDFCQVVRPLRDLVLFAPHNLLTDPPLSKMDLIVCRHVLMTMEASHHTRLLTAIQFGLQPDGFLFLGASESPEAFQHLFQPLDARWRIYRKTGNLAPSSPTWRAIERPASPLPREAAQIGAHRPAAQPQAARAVEHLLAAYCPPTLLVDDRHQLLRIIGDASPYLQTPAAMPGMAVLQLLREDLRLPVRTVLRRLQQAPQESVSHYAQARLGDGPHHVAICGRRQRDDVVTTLSLETVDRGGDAAVAVQDKATQTPEQERLEVLERLLSSTQETLQGAMAELEADNAALRQGEAAMAASHETLLMANEELQTTNEALYAVHDEQQQRIAALTRQASDMDNLLRSTEIGAIYLDPELRIRQFTPAIADVFHLLPHDIGRPIDDLALRLDDERLLQDASQVLRTGLPMVQDVRRSPDQWLLRRLHPYRTEEGRCEGVVLTLVDVSELKATEDRLQQSEKRFRDLIEESVQGIAIYRSGRPLFVNRACARLFGYGAPQDMLALDDLVADIAAPHDYARLWHYTQRLLEENAAPVHLEFQGQRQDGGMIWVACAMRCVMWEGDGAVQATLVDITERKRAEEALARKTLELQRSNDDLEQFAYVASHDLQEPLRLVSSYLYLLQDRCAGQVGADAEQFLAFAIDGAGRMQRLIQELLAYARLGQQDLTLKSIAGDTVLDAALATLRFALKESGAKVTRERLPTMRVDPAQMELVLRHLISNAIKFRGKRRPHIDIRAEFRGGAWLFAVRDNGIGIAPQDVDRLFTLFQRLHPRDIHAGAGIGLALCKRIVERHGGRIWVESQPGEGATFTFTIPA